MSYIKRIVCLANSFKTGGSCIAGKEIVASGYGGWIRPVSTRPTAEVWASECRYENNMTLKLLDVIDVPLLNPAPKLHQTENHEMDVTRRWLKVGELPWGALPQLCDKPQSLWINSGQTKTGILNRISPAEAVTLSDSLMLIRPHGFVVRIELNSRTGKKAFRGNFEYDNTAYSLSLTDPVATNAFASRDVGDYPLNDTYLCISLTEVFEKDGQCHKLVAAVISNPPL